MKKFGTAVIMVVMAAAGIGGALYYTSETDAVPTDTRPKLAPNVAVHRAFIGDIRRTVQYTATIEPEDSVTVLPKVTGQLQSFEVDLGDFVEKEQVIARIESAEFEQRVKQAEANLKLAQASLDRSIIEREAAAREYRRYENASREGVSTEQELDTAQSELEKSEANVVLAEAEVARAESALEEAKLNLANTIIRAPLTGQIDKRRVDEGALVSANSPLCDIVNINPAKVVVNVPESEIALAVVGGRTFIDVPRADLNVGGRIDRVAPTVDMATRTATVEITIPNDNGRLLPGMSADVTFVAGEVEDVLIIPEEAILRDTDSLAVNRVEDGRVIRTPIQLGLASKGYAQVTSGLDEGDLVIVRGNFMVEDGDEVEYQVRGEGVARADT